MDALQLEPIIELALVVETRAALRGMFGRLLTATGVAEVMQAQTVVEALGMLETARHGRLPSMIVVDLDGTDGEGIVLIEQVRTHADPRIAHMAVLVASSETSIDAVRHLAALGVDQFVMKPVSLQQLTDSVEAVARRQRPALAMSYG